MDGNGKNGVNYYEMMETLVASVMVISARFSIVMDDLGLNIDASWVPSYFQQ